jgi:tetratricopeptide (TPR) repeat protein
MGEILKARWFQVIAVLVLIISFVVIFMMMSRTPVKEEPNIAANIDGVKITNLEFQVAVNRRLLRIISTQGSVSSADKESIMLSVFKGLMNDTMLRVFAKEEGVSVTPAELERKKQDLIKMLGGKNGLAAATEDPYAKSQIEQELTPEGRYKQLWTSLGFRTEEEFLKDLETEVLEDKLSQHLYPENSYTVTDAEISEYIPVGEYQQIVLGIDPSQPAGMEINFSTRKVWDRAREIYGQLKSGADFAQMAKRYSQEAAYASNGGYIGYINKRSVVPQFWAVASTMQPGEISEPFETPFGIHILKCLDRRDPNDPMFKDIRLFSRKVALVRKRKSDFVGWFYRRFRELEESNKIILYSPTLLANKLRNMGEFDAAVDEYRKAIETDSEGAPYYHIDISLIYSRQRKYDEALRELRIATEQAPTDPLLFFALGEAYMEVGEHEKALSEFAKASDMSKLNYDLHDRLEKIYTQLGLMKEADHEHELYVKAIQILSTGSGAMAPGSMFMNQEYRLPKGAFQQQDTVREDSPLKQLLPQQ